MKDKEVRKLLGYKEENSRYPDGTKYQPPPELNRLDRIEQRLRTLAGELGYVFYDQLEELDKLRKIPHKNGKRP